MVHSHPPPHHIVHSIVQYLSLYKYQNPLWTFSKPEFPHNIHYITWSKNFNSTPIMAIGGSSSNSKSNSLIHHPTNLKGGWHAAIFIICESKSSLYLFSPSPISLFSLFLFSTWLSLLFESVSDTKYEHLSQENSNIDLSRLKVWLNESSNECNSRFFSFY